MSTFHFQVITHHSLKPLPSGSRGRELKSLRRARVWKDAPSLLLGLLRVSLGGTLVLEPIVFAIYNKLLIYGPAFQPPPLPLWCGGGVVLSPWALPPVVWWCVVRGVWGGCSVCMTIYGVVGMVSMVCDYLMYGMFHMYGMFGMYCRFSMYGKFGIYGMFGMYGMNGWYCMDGRYGM